MPPVLPGARVVCIGLNYLKHVAEGSYKDQQLQLKERDLQLVVVNNPTIIIRQARILRFSVR